MKKVKFVSGLIFGVTGAFILQGIGYYGFSLGNVKDASNFWSSYARFQAVEKYKPPLVFVGSSITARLPAAECGYLKVGNLGTDGGDSLNGVRLITQEGYYSPEVVIIEVNTLFKTLSPPQEKLISATQGLWYCVGTKCDLLGARCRPSRVLYSMALRRPIVFPKDVLPYSLPSETASAVSMSVDNRLTLEEEHYLTGFLSRISELRKVCKKIILVRYPSSQLPEKHRELNGIITERIRKKYNLPFLDLSSSLRGQKVSFSDGVHMDPETAARVLLTIETYLDITPSK